MMGVKLGISIFPKSFRNFVKKSPALTSLYSHSLQKSGLFYGFPNAKKLQVLYSNRLKAQSAEIEKIIKSQRVLNKKFDVVIFKRADGELTQTLESLNNQSEFINKVYVLKERQTCAISLKLAVDVEWNASLNFFVDSTSSIPIIAVNQGDRLDNMALAVFARQKLQDLLYTDSDEITLDNEFRNPRLLPGWNPDLLLSTGYIESTVIINRLILKDVDLTGVQEIPSLVVSLFKFFKNLKVLHLPLSLVHFTTNKRFKLKTLKGLSRLTEGLGAKSSCDQALLLNRVRWPSHNSVLVSLIIPTKNAKGLVQICIESILKKSTYRHFEILLLDNNSDDVDALEYFEYLNKYEQQIRVIQYPYEFNYSAINNFAVKHARGEVIGLVNNDIEVISPNWMTDMVGHVMRPDIGCVGAKLLYPDERIQHAGVVMGYGGGAGHAHKYFPRYHPGYLNRLAATNNFSAVTAACLFVTKEDYNLVGGLDEDNLKVAFNDVDFCLKVSELGRRNVYCAEVELFHHESVSRGLDNTKEKRQRFESELRFIQTKWADYIENDPAYNSNLTLRHENFSIRE